MDSDLSESLVFEEKGDGDEQHSEPRDDDEQKTEPAPPMHFKHAVVVKWWEDMVEKAHKRHDALRDELEKSAAATARAAGAPHTGINRVAFTDQLRVGIAVHLTTRDGVCTRGVDDDKICPLRFPRIKQTHSDSLKKMRDETRVTKPTLIEGLSKGECIFPNRLRVEDAWRVMKRYDPNSEDEDQRWKYHAGDIVEVRGLDMRWHMGVVTFARQSEAKEDDNEKDDDCDKEKQLVNVVRPNDRMDIGNDANEVRVPADAVRLLFGRKPFLWQQVRGTHVPPVKGEPLTKFISYCQYALLLAEEKMRYEEFHPDDYLEVGWKDWARKKFQEWVDGPGNDEDTGRSTHHSPEFKKYYEAFHKVRISLPSSL
jgi:hypothetical protein